MPSVVSGEARGGTSLFPRFSRAGDGGRAAAAVRHSAASGRRHAPHRTRHGPKTARDERRSRDVAALSSAARSHDVCRACLLSRVEGKRGPSLAGSAPMFAFTF